MSRVKSFAVGNGDMFYIEHDSDNFSIIDCCLSEENKEQIVKELIEHSKDKGVVRFISTHPDDDHFRGIRFLDTQMGIANFYCVKNNVVKKDETKDFLHYCELRDSEKAFYIRAGCKRRWMNLSDKKGGAAGINVLWPDTDNSDFEGALELAEHGGSPNNMSAVVRYELLNGASFSWMGDLETTFMEKIADAIEWPKTDIIFAAHHGRDSGRIPHSILDQLRPKIIVLGEAPSRHLNYYGGYHTLTQNTAGDITFECEGGEVHIFASEYDYEEDFLGHKDVVGSGFYVGTLEL
jgi:beta-lactamase superfamily II metal-dependent hydrolase